MKPTMSPLILFSSSFFKRFSTFPAPPAVFTVLSLWLNVWLCHIECVFLLSNGKADLHLSNLGTLVLEAPCTVRRKVYCRFETDDKAFAITLT